MDDGARPYLLEKTTEMITIKKIGASLFFVESHSQPKSKLEVQTLWIVKVLSEQWLALNMK